MDSTPAGNMVVGGSTKNRPFFQSGDSSNSIGLPFFEYYASSNCAFSWSIYFDKNLDSETVTVKFKSDFTEIAGAFIERKSSAEHVNIIILNALDGSLIKLVKE
jgi:hypothetical protein